ncbi:MAG: cysteine desulfurase [Bacteroidota bacterium]
MTCSMLDQQLLLEIKNDFPLLRQKMKNGQSLAYLDNAATTQKPHLVIEAMVQYYQKQNANVHRGIYQLAAEATAAYEGSRQKVAQFIGAAKAAECIFVKGTTEGINLVAQSFTAPQLQAGDEVLISAMEHHSNLVPWQILCQQKGAQLRVIPMNQKGELDLDAFAGLLNPKVKMLAIVHLSNTLGTINPIEQMIQMAHQEGIPVLVDGAQSIMSEAIDVQALDCDFFVFSGHKLFGPTGIGVLYGKTQHLDSMMPYQLGGEMIRSVSFEKTTFARIPNKLEAGTPNIVGAIALGKAIEYVEKLGKQTISAQLQTLLTYATEQLQSIAGLNIIGQAAQKSSVLSFTLDGVHPHDVATILNEHGLALRAGHHCTQPIMDFYHIPATTRASFAVYNTINDIDRLCEAINDIKNIFA